MATALKDYKKEIIKQITQLGYRHSSWQVFSDFCEMSAVSISNAVDWIHKDEREKQYLEIVKRYDKKEIELFPQMLANLVEGLEVCAMDRYPDDILGQMFHELELHNKYKGQFFTPAHVCDMMGRMSLSEHDEEIIHGRGYLTVCEPCVGSGAMIFGFSKAMTDCHFNYCKQMVVTATDVDLKCVHMAYLQLSLYGIPAVVIHGDTLRLKEWSRWYTPAYMLDGWIWRETCGNINKRYPEDEAFKCAQEPLYAAIRKIETAVPVNESPENVIKPPKSVNEHPENVIDNHHFDIEFKEKKNGQISLF